MRTRTVLMGLLFAAVTPVAVSAQSQQSALVALRQSLDAATYAQFTTELRAAEQRGLPVDALVAKAQEGAAKNVAGARIMVAVRDMTQRLGRAQALLGGPNAAAGADVSAVATALQRGVPEDAIRRLVADGPGRASVALSSHALADLLGHGVPLAVGLEVIGEWRTRGGNAAQLAEIPAAIERLVRQGVVPAHAGAAVAAGLRNGRALGTILPQDVPRGPGNNRGGGN